MSSHEFTGSVSAAGTATSLSGVTITVKNTATGSTQTTVTDDKGDYQINVSVGTYDLTASKSGYIPETQSNLTVSSDTDDLGRYFILVKI